MFRSSCVAIALTVATGLSQSIAVQPQEDAPAGQPAAKGFELKPKVIIEEPEDEGSLTEKAGFFIGYQMGKNLKSQLKDELDLDQVYEGMKAADKGPSKASYVAGYQFMQNLKKQEAELQLEKIFEGMKLALSDGELGMSQEEVTVLMKSYSKTVEKKRMEKLKKQSDANLAEGEAYMAKNAADNPKVKTLDNGVQYEVLVEGDGPIPSKDSKVKVDYHGTFLDGTVFDSSIKPPSGRPAKPAEMRVLGVVPGFSKVLQSMKVGSKWRVVIPGPQAYKMSGRGSIGPNQALIFEVELLEILE